MRAHISYDLLMNDDMSFVEGTYRLPGGEWQVFIFVPDSRVVRPEVNATGKWPSGVTGVFVKWPPTLKLNKAAVLQLLSEQLRVTAWDEVQGPDSMKLR
jgi:hypothetical protein